MSRKRLLIIDGDEAFAREVADVAERRGFETTTCATSVEGLELAASQQPDLVVVNVELAPTNGWSVCIKLKKDEALQHIPVVLTSSTSTADTFEKHKKLRTRADDYLLKPYEPEQLVDLAGQLVGLPDVGEPLVDIDDAPGFEGEYELEADDAFSIAEDEPLGEVEFESDDGFASFDDEADPTVDAPSDDEWGHDPLGDPLAIEPGEEAVAFDDEVEPLPEPPEEAALEEFARGEFATSEFSAGALAAATAALQAEAAQGHAMDPLAGEHLDPLGDPLADDAWGAEEVDPLAAFDDDTDFADVAAFEEEAAAEPEDDFSAAAPEASFEAEPFPDALPEDGGYDEAPLEVPGLDADEAGEEALIEELGSALDDGDFDLGDDVGLGGDALAGAELARLGELEAELDGLRAAEAASAEELGRLRNDLAARDDALFEVRGQLEARERELRELTASHTAEVSRAAAEKARREATVRSLTGRGEQLTAALRKAERDAAAAREEAARLPELEARLASREAELETTREQAFQAESLQQRLEAQEAAAEKDRAALASVTHERDQALADLQAARAEADGLRTDLDEARRTAERALENTGTLQEKLAEANERVEAAERRVEELERANARARETLLQMVEGLGTA